MYSGLLPPSSTPLQRALSTAVQKDIPVPIRTLKSAAACPMAVLPWLAWERGVDEWSDDWSEQQQRAVIQASITQHRKRGTAAAVEEALATIGITVRIQEWHKQQPLGAPYTYKLLVDVGQIGVSQVQLQRMLRVVERAKNLRSHMTSVDIKVTSEAVMSGVASTSAGIEIETACSVQPLVLSPLTLAG